MTGGSGNLAGAPLPAECLGSSAREHPVHDHTDEGSLESATGPAQTFPPRKAARRSRWLAAALSPLRRRLFFAIWMATLVSNFGGMIHGVGASWLMAEMSSSAQLVALVQAAATLPIMLFSLPGGVAADLWDRRGVMLVATCAMMLVSVGFAVSAFLGLLTPPLLLGLSFLLACGVAFYNPAWQSSVREQVPKAALPRAVALNSLGFNLARTAGPAIGGVIVAVAGASAAFIVNAFSYLGLIVVLARWRRPARENTLPGENALSAMVAGAHYAWWSPAIRVVLLRAAVFGLLAVALWALIPVIARDQLDGGPFVYGLLLGAFGVGAVIGALLVSGLRARCSPELILRLSSLAFGGATIACALSPWEIATMLALLIAGAAWVVVLSTFNVMVQLSAPAWVVGRAVAVYQSIVFGGFALGSWGWGAAVEQYGLAAALVVAGCALAASVTFGLCAPLPPMPEADLRPRDLAALQIEIDIQPQSGPVVTRVEYRVANADVVPFVRGMLVLRQIRQRDGARAWRLAQDIGDPETWVEQFESVNWIEHLRRRTRTTVADGEARANVRAFHLGPEPPRVNRLLQHPGGTMSRIASGAAADPTSSGPR